MPQTYFISDTHFGHSAILKFSPWRGDQLKKLGLPITIESHDAYIRRQWNSTVHQDDTVYFLGDLGLFSKPEEFVETLSGLKGKKILFHGNHDFEKELKRSLSHPETNVIEVVETAKIIKINGLKLWFSHYAALLPPPYISIHGHIHESEYSSPFFKMLNISLDSPFNQTRPFAKPISLPELVDQATKLDKQRRELILNKELDPVSDMPQVILPNDLNF